MASLQLRPMTIDREGCSVTWDGRHLRRRKSGKRPCTFLDREITEHGKTIDWILSLWFGHSLRIRLHTGDPLRVSTTQYCCLAGVWLDVLLIIGTDAWVNLNGDIALTKEVPANMRALPFGDVRLWGAGNSTVEFDNFIVCGNGVTADEAVSWGQLKSLYR